MAQNNNHLSSEELDNIFNNIKDWINNIDTKISFLLTFSCIFLGYILESDISIFKLFNEWHRYLAVLIFLVLVLSFSVISVILFLLALKAKTKHRISTYYSIIFAGDISQNPSFEEYNQKISNLTNNQLLDDKKKQIYINACIYSKKVKLYNLGLGITITTMILYMIYKIILVSFGIL